MNNSLIRFRALWVIILCLGVTALAKADIRASVSKNQISMGETVDLTIILDDQVLLDQLDLSVLEQNFDIAGRSSRTLVSMKNGKVSNETQLDLSLRPKSSGVLTIPAITSGTERTEPFELRVLEENAKRPQQDDTRPPVLIEAFWENTAKPYVQSQLNLVIRIYHRGSLSGAALDEPRPKNALVKRLGEDAHGVKTKNGIEYQTLERRFAVFPQTSGKFTVPAIPMQMRAPVPKDQAERFYGFDVFSRQMITLRTEPLVLDVLPRSADGKAPNWLPAEQIELQRSGLPDGDVSVGDAINLQLVINAIGLNAEQLPELSFSIDENQFSVYPDEPLFENATDGRVIVGNRNQTFVLIPRQVGELIIPKIELAWWDKTMEKQMLASLPQVQLNVLAAPGAETNQMVLEPAERTDDIPNSQGQSLNEPASGDTRFWKWIALSVFILWLLTLGYFLFFRRPSARFSEGIPEDLSPNSTQSFNTIKQALKAKRWKTLWQALNQYGHAQWPDNPPNSPRSWALKLEEPKVEAIFSSFEDCLFGEHGSGIWQENNFKIVVLPLLKRAGKSKRRSLAKPCSNRVLPSLYPSA